MVASGLQAVWAQGRAAVAGKPLRNLAASRPPHGCHAANRPAHVAEAFALACPPRARTRAAARGPAPAGVWQVGSGGAWVRSAPARGQHRALVAKPAGHLSLDQQATRPLLRPGAPASLDEVALDTPIARLLQQATPVCEIAADDGVLDYDITHRELVELFGLQPRHLRVFTQKRSLTGIFPYEDMVVFKFEHLKGLLFWDRIMVFDADQASVAAFIEHLRAGVRRNVLVEARLKQPFELVALEGLLDELAVHYESSFARLDFLIRGQLDKIVLEAGDEVREDSLYKLLPLEHKVNSLAVRVDRALKTLDQLLHQDEDMAACYLTYRQEEGAPAPASEHLQVGAAVLVPMPLSSG